MAVENIFKEVAGMNWLERVEASITHVPPLVELEDSPASAEMESRVSNEDVKLDHRIGS